MTAIWLAAAFLAYTIKGFTGFGPALIIIPVLSVLHSPQTALGTSSLLDVVVGACFLAYLRLTMSQLKILSRMLISLIAGTVLGAASVAVLPSKVILVLVGLSILGLAFQLLRRPHPETSRPRRQIPLQLSCFLGGISGGLVGISGPFLVAGTARFEKNDQRRLLVAIFFIESLVRVAIYTLTGTLSGEAIHLGLIALPAAAVALLLGVRLHSRVSQPVFTKVVGWILMAVAIPPLITAFL
jgi:uncharacterized protein